MELTPEKKLAGILAPIFALRGRNDLGIGDVGALREFVEWSARHGFGLVQLLPINETGNDNSPYNAISSVAIDPTTIEITPETVPDLSEEGYREVLGKYDLEALRAASVKYAEVKRLKRELLARAFERFTETSWKRNDVRARKLRSFIQEEKAWLEDYALFRVLMDLNGTECWDKWPEVQRTAAQSREWLKGQPAAKQRELEQKMRFAKYIQWIAWAQWREAKAHAEKLGVALMGDIPFGVSYYSADVWSLPEIFDHQWCGGCGPEKILEVDEFTKKWGQNWGIPLYRWDVMREGGHTWWRQRVQKVREVFHLFRIDHVLGVFRIYSFPWRPNRNQEFLPLTEEEAAQRTGGELPHFIPFADDTPEHKAANEGQGEEILKVLLEVCGKNRLIGEDLGVVPDYVRPCLQRLGIAGFKVPQWENEPDGRMIDGANYERLSLATYATHDHDPLRTMWDGWMQKIKAAESGDPEAAPARDTAWHETRRMAHWAGFEVPRAMPFDDEIHERLLGGLFRSNSWFVVCQISDIFGSSQRFNVPGSAGEENWTARLPKPVSEWDDDPEIAGKVSRIERMLAETDRLKLGGAVSNPA